MISPRSCVLVLKIHHAPYAYADQRFHPSIDDMVEKVVFERVDWFFPDCKAKGITHAYVPGRCKELDGFDSPRGVIIPGYRCPECKKVFFASDFADFSHECQESA